MYFFKVSKSSIKIDFTFKKNRFGSIINIVSFKLQVLKAMPRKFLSIFIFVLFAASCSSTNQTTSTSLLYKDYRIEKETKKDPLLEKMLQPYAISLSATMDKVIGFSNNGLSARQPESGLGNFMADCMRIMAEKKFNKKVDAGFMNQFGIRSYIPKGNITIGKIFEIMPFDNLVVLQEISGSVLHQFLDKIASNGGWPVSGVKMGIKDKKAVNITISGSPLNETAIYTIANSDYVASGGDNAEMLRNVPQQNKGYLFRDALVEYVSNFTQQGKPVDQTIENRVVNVN
jgi:2',3'-cyclic-nucleotide 2'-phosphodiesterase (5'-nucleotidase family)